jgi:hypothetical protein
MISSRFVRPVALAIALATVPTIRHTYLQQVVPDGRTTAPVEQVLSHLASTPGERTASWMQRVLATEDWFDRTYRVGSKQIRLFVARSYDAKRLYHHPEIALVRGSEITVQGVVRAEGRPEIPLHLLTTRSEDEPGLILYALHYGDGFVDDPIRFQIRSAGSLLFSGRRPMTLFFAMSDENGDAFQRSEAARLLFTAVDAFLKQKPGA